MPADRSDTANALALAKKIVARDSSSLSALGAALQGLTSVTCLEPTSQQLAKLLMKYVGRDDVDMDAMCRLGSGLELVAAFHRLSRLNVQTFVHANGHLNPVAALTKAVAVPRSPAPSVKTPWKHMKPKHSGVRGEVTWADEIKEHRNLPPVVAPTSTLRSMYAAHSGSQSALGQDRAQFVVTFWILCLLALVVYVSLRIWDIVEMHFINGGPWKSAYRTAVLLVEVTYAVAALAYLRLAWTVPKHVNRRRDFKPEALVTVLMATDENADTIVTSVMAHTNAVRPPRIPIKIIVVVQNYSDAVIEARDRIAQLVSNVTFLDYQQLADHEPGTTLLGEDAPIVETIAVPRRMTMSQALYLCLSGINRKYPLDRAVVCVAEASVMINTLEHYKFAISKLRQKGTAVVSFPCVAQNESAVADLMDLSAQRLQQVVLPAIQVSGQCVVSHMCFAGRGTDMLNVLRAMELDSAGSRTLAWLPFYIHKTVGFSKRATPVLDGPPASTLNPRNGPARLAAAIYPIMEQWDIGSFLSRQFGARWTWASGLTVPHIMYSCTILLEATVIVVAAVAAWAHVAPASAGRVLMASVFTLHYGLLILSGLLTTAGFQFSMLSTMLAARILVPFLVTVYGFGQSRFGVDRRGHFQSVGDITTAPLWKLRGAWKGQEEAPLMKVETEDPAQDEAGEDSGDDMWDAPEPDTAMVSTWSNRGFSSSIMDSSNFADAAMRTTPRGRGGMTPRLTPRTITPRLTPRLTPRRTPRLLDRQATRKNLPQAGPSQGSHSSKPGGSGANQVPRFNSLPSNSMKRSVRSGQRVQAQPVGEAVEIEQAPLGEAVEGQSSIPPPRRASMDPDGLNMPPNYPSYHKDNAASSSLLAPSGNLPQQVPPSHMMQHHVPRATPQMLDASVPLTETTAQLTTVLDDELDSGPMMELVFRRTGEGIINGLSMPRTAFAIVLAVVMLGLSTAVLATALARVFLSPSMRGYTALERLAGDPWGTSTICLCVFTLIPTLILLTNAALPARVNRTLVHNSLAGPILLLLSLASLFAVPTVHMLNSVVLGDGFSDAHQLAPVPMNELAQASVNFLGQSMAGPVPENSTSSLREASDIGVRNPVTNESLAGGWYTGPGLAKVTLPQAALVCDLALAVWATAPQLREMGVLTAVTEQLRHGLDYLVSATSEDGSVVVSSVADTLVPEPASEWRRPSEADTAERHVSFTSPAHRGTEVYSLVAAAFASGVVALEATSVTATPAEQKYVAGLKRNAHNVFSHADKAAMSYANTMSAANISTVWPTAQAKTVDKQLYAATWMLLMDPSDSDAKNIMNYYYSYTEERTNWSYCSVDIDSFWVVSNLVLAQAEQLPLRYSLHMERCIRLWTTGAAPHAPHPADWQTFSREGLLLLRRTSTRSSRDTGEVEGPRPLPLGMRAMAYTALYTSKLLDQYPTARNGPMLSAACFTIQQLRLMLGYNSEGFSYVVGVGRKGAGWPQQARSRVASCPIGQPCSRQYLEDPDANAFQATGALVHGPTWDGDYTDSRPLVQNSGTSVLNSSPLVLLAAAHQKMGLKPQDCVGMGAVEGWPQGAFSVYMEMVK